MDQAKDPSAKATGYGAVARAQLLSRELLKAVEVGGLELGQLPMEDWNSHP